MAIDTTIRNTAGVTTGTATTGARSTASSRLAAARATEAADAALDSAAASSETTVVPLRIAASSGSGSQVDSALQDSVARAQQAIDYLNRVSTQLESLKSELTSKIASARSNARQASAQSSSAQSTSPSLATAVRQLALTLAARGRSGGGSVDSDLTYTKQPATQSFRIRGVDIASLKQNAPQTVAFSVGSNGGPQTAVNVEPDTSSPELAKALDRALAPMGLHASLDADGELVFSTPESNWPAVQDSIAISGRGRVTTDAVTPSLAPQQWNVVGTGDSGGGGNADALRQSLREVVQALERVRHSQAAASAALAAATVQVAAAQTPPPDVQMAADDFASAASNTDYDSLLSLTSALVGVSRERVVALLGLS